MARSAKDKSQEPWVENYPPLREWLDKHGARCMSQVRNGDGYLEIWSVRGRAFVVQVHARQHGWNIYTDLNSINISESLLDAEKRLGL